MRSFRQKPDNRRDVYLNLAGSIEGQLRQAFALKSDAGQETQADLARKLGVDRSVINRRLAGRSNMTIETIADMVWGLGQCIKVDIFDPTANPTNSGAIVPTPVTFTTSNAGSSRVAASPSPVSQNLANPPLPMKILSKSTG